MYTILSRTDIDGRRGTTYESKPMRFREAKEKFNERVVMLHKKPGTLTLDVKPFTKHSFIFSTYQDKVKVVEITWIEEI